jgi:hypothetical protein
MDTTSFYFENDDFRSICHVKFKLSEDINEKTTNEKIYSDPNKNGDKNK